MSLESPVALVDDALGPPVVTVEQVDVHDGAARRWTFHTSGGLWHGVGHDGVPSEPVETLRAALSESDALDPLPRRAMIIEAAPHTVDVLAELAERIVDQGDFAIFDAEWHPSVRDLDGMNQEFLGNQRSWLDSAVPVLVDESMCGTLDGGGNPIAFLFWGPSDDTSRASVQFHEQWLTIEILSPHDSYAVVAGEVAPGRFAVEHTGPDFFVRLEVEPGVPDGEVQTLSRLRRIFEDETGLHDPSELDRLIVMEHGRYFVGSFESSYGPIDFEGVVEGLGRDLIRTIAQEFASARRSD